MSRFIWQSAAALSPARLHHHHPSLSSWLPSFRTESPGKGWALCSVCSQLWVDTGTSTLAWFWKYNFKIPLLVGKLLRNFFSCPLLPLTRNLRFRVKRCFQFTDGKGGLRSIWAVCSLLHRVPGTTAGPEWSYHRLMAEYFYLGKVRAKSLPFHFWVLPLFLTGIWNLNHW